MQLPGNPVKEPTVAFQSSHMAATQGTSQGKAHPGAVEFEVHVLLFCNLRKGGQILGVEDFQTLEKNFLTVGVGWGRNFLALLNRTADQTQGAGGRGEEGAAKAV